MASAAATILATSEAATKLLAPAARPRSALLHLVFSLGLFGLFFVAIVDSSFVPLPLPGITDIMLIVLAARHGNIALLLIVSSVGSVIGGYLSYRAGYRGGIALLEKHVKPRILKLVRDKMEHHAIMAVALPAILPPPMPLSPFVLAAGALRMDHRRFLAAFSISRSLRHALAIWLGVRYGHGILRLWNHISARYETPVAVVLWTAIFLAAAIACWKLYKSSRSHSQEIAGHTRSTV